MPARDNPDLDPALADAVRRAYVRPVDEDTASRHVNAIVAAAQASARPLARPQRRRRRLWAPVAVAVAAGTFLLPVGLAAAGVSLPSVVEDPYRAVGITLPNQAKHAPSAPAPLPVTPGAPAATATTAAPETATTAAPRHAGEPGASRSPATGNRGHNGSTAPGQSASRRPSTGSSGTGVSKKPVTPPAASSRKPAAPQSSRKPARPAKPAAPQSTRRNPGNRPGVATPPSATSQAGNGRGNASPKAGANGR